MRDGHTADLSPCHNVWCTFSGLYYRCKTGLYMFYPIILCLSTISDVQSDSVMWNEAEFNPTVVGNYVTVNVTCDIGLVQRKVWTSWSLWTSEIAIFCLQSKNPWLTISLWPEYFDLTMWFYLGWKLAIFCVEYKYMNTTLLYTTIWSINPIKFSWNFSH